MRPRLIPILLLRSGGLYKTRKFAEPVYIGDPINAVRIFNEKGVDEIVLLDIDATVEGRGPNFERITDIVSEAFVPICYGGGVRSIDDFSRLMKLGVEKVAVTSAVANDFSLITEAASLFGSQSVVVGIDVRRGLFNRLDRVVRSGKDTTRLLPLDAALAAEAAGAGEILLNSVDRDGMMSGYDEKLVSLVSDAVGIPVIASGGAASLDDMLQAVFTGGASAAAAGSLFVFQGKHRAVLITYPDERAVAEATKRHVPEKSQ
ncbi:MAG: imidazole glycerol phosphate synthase subunit HisF [Hyphomicrobiales bacterium]|nr:MAG: imidazole glycerol phosphate synthase subunit HisF [Hyphomicrobiales bacterium]